MRFLILYCSIILSYCHAMMVDGNETEVNQHLPPIIEHSPDIEIKYDRPFTDLIYLANNGNIIAQQHILKQFEKGKLAQYQLNSLALDTWIISYPNCLQDPMFILAFLHSTAPLQHKEKFFECFQYTITKKLGQPDWKDFFEPIFYLKTRSYLTNNQRRSFYKILHELAHKGHCLAQYFLGCFYESEGELETAGYYYKLAASLKHAEAAFRAGMLYENNNLEKYVNKLIAISFYKYAANLEHPEAIFNMAYIYERWMGVTPKIIACYKMAAAQGETRAVQRLSQIKMDKNMPPEDFARDSTLFFLADHKVHG